MSRKQRRSTLGTVRTTRPRRALCPLGELSMHSGRRLLLEPLEERRLLATLAEAASTLTITLDNNSETLGISSAGGSYAITSSSPFVNGGVTAGRVSAFGGTSASITAAGLAAYNTIQIVDGLGIQGTRVTFNDSGANVYSDSFIVNLSQDTDVGAGESRSVLFLGASSFGAGSLHVTTLRDIVVGEFAPTTLSTSSGGISLNANTAGTTSGSFNGIALYFATVTSSGSGSVELNGTGGLGGNGIYMRSGSRVMGGLAGTSVSVHGTGSGPTGSVGVVIDAFSVTGTGTMISSNGANVEVVGHAGGSVVSSGNKYGVYVAQGTISAGGSGNVVVTGTGGNGTATFNYGVNVDGATAVITSNGGSVQVTGYGGKNGGAAAGVRINNGRITAGGNGNVAVTGTGGDFGGNNFGVLLSGTGILTSSGGNVQVTGQGGNIGTAGTDNHGVSVSLNTQISAGGSGTLSVDGIGGNATNRQNYGVYVNGTITSAGGAVAVTGQGGGNGADSTSNYGVFVTFGRISAGGNGAVVVNGTGSASVGTGNDGVQVTSSGEITSSGGSVQVVGQGGGTSTSPGNNGVRLISGGRISAAGAGAVQVAATGGIGISYGLIVEGTNSRITSGGGPVQLTAAPGAAPAHFRSPSTIQAPLRLPRTAEISR